MEKCISFFKQHGPISVIGLALVISLLLTFGSARKVDQNLNWVLHTHQVIQGTEQYFSLLKDCQAAQHAHLLTGKDSYLTQYEEGKKRTIEQLTALRDLTADNPLQQDRLTRMEADLKRKLREMDLALMLQMQLGADSARAMAKKDRGSLAMEVIRYQVKAFAATEEKLLSLRQAQYQDTQQKAQFVQLGTLLLVAVSLWLILSSVDRAGKARKQLFAQIDGQNRTLLMDAGNDHQQTLDEKRIVERLVTNLKNATAFITHIGQGQYEVDFPGITPANLPANQHNLSGSLLHMREQLKRVAQEDRHRNWATQGLAQFGELLRVEGADKEGLAGKIISHLVKYLEANQGALFEVHGPRGQEAIELTACYAYGRKKYLRKSLAVGEGLVGQAVQEADTVYLTDVPDGYLTITSGLGEATPRAILIVPLKGNGQVYGVVELASFGPFEPYQIAFVEKLAESLASALSSVRINEQTQRLLAESQQQAQMLGAQEEEMRQNLEEIAATQEEMQRKNTEMERLLAQAEERESMLKAQEGVMQEAMEQLQQAQQTSREREAETQQLLASVEKQESGIRALIDNTTDSIFAIDHCYRITAFNEAFRHTMAARGVTLSVGTDMLALAGENQQERFKSHYERALSGEAFSLEEQFEGQDHKRSMLLNYYPVRLEEQVIGVAVFAKDISELKRKEERMQQYVAQMHAQEEMMMQSMEQLRAVQADILRREEHLKALIDNTEDTILAVDANYRLISFNQALAKHYRELGIQIETGYDVLSLFTPDQLPVYKWHYDRALSGERFSVREHLVVGSLNRDCAINYAPIRVGESVVGVSVFARDVTGLLQPL